MATLNLVKVGGLVKVEYTGRSDVFFNRNSTVVKFTQPEDGTENILVTIGNENCPVDAITDIQVDGVAITDQADFETKIATVFPDANSGNGGTGTLAEVLAEGNQTGDNDIEARDGETWNGARLVVGNNRAGVGRGEFNNGGDNGVSLYCANDGALDYQNKVLRHRDQGSNAPKPLPTISPIRYPGTVFEGLTNTSTDSPIISAGVEILFNGQFNTDFETYFNYTSTFRVYLYDGTGNLLAIAKYDGANYVDPTTSLYLFDITEIADGATIDQVVKVVGYDFHEDALITVKEANRRFVEKLTQPKEFVFAPVCDGSTNAPTITILKNDFGEVPTPSYISTGTYTLTFTNSPMTVGRTLTTPVGLVKGNLLFGLNTRSVEGLNTNANTFYFETREDGTLIDTDEILAGQFIFKITVYP